MPSSAHRHRRVKDPSVVQANGKWHVSMTTRPHRRRLEHGLQHRPPACSTSSDPGDPQSWSAPKDFQTSGFGGGLDYWVICDDSMCYLFAANDDGKLYRSETTVADFPDGFHNTRSSCRTPSTPGSKETPSTTCRAPTPTC